MTIETSIHLNWGLSATDNKGHSQFKWHMYINVQFPRKVSKVHELHYMINSNSHMGLVHLIRPPLRSAFRHKAPIPQSGLHTIIDCVCLAPALRIRVSYAEKLVLKGCHWRGLKRGSYKMARALKYFLNICRRLVHFSKCLTTKRDLKY